jgi:tetratricopeptide (TPR) repeat protein
MMGGTLGPYRLDRELGAGGMGKVWAARVEGRVPGLDVGAVVALKVVHPHLLETPGFFKRFLREAEIGKSVVHENVVRTYDCDAVRADGQDQHFLVMEYVEGQTLRGLLAELERVPEELCRHIGREVAKGLAAIHAAGVVHRDMKPENVLITKEHAVKVMDLGVARLADEQLRLSQSGAFIGSVEYAAPEQFGGAGVDHRADLHALGLILYELSCAQHPYRADSFPAVMKKVREDVPRRLGDVNPQISPFFEEVVHTLLAKTKEARVADAATLVAVLEEGEKSAWWKERAKAIRAETKRPLRRIRIPRETAVYGRETELAKLHALFAKAKSGDGQVVLIEGEAGIGKSRLVDELVGRLQRDGEDLNFLFGSYPPGGAATAAGALSTAFREHVGDSGVAAYLPQTPLLVPAFEALLRGDATPAGCEGLTRDSIATCFVQALRALAAERPTVLLVDDLHFASEDSRAMFTSLALAVPGHRILLVGTTRPANDEKWLSGLTRLPQTSQMAVGRLGPKDLALLLKDSFKSEGLAQSLGVQIGMKSDGNPFFAFEIIRGLREGQFITQRDDGTWVSTRVIDDIKIPSSVLDLVNARVADLTEDERNLLDVASCWGFEFDPLLVGEVLAVARIPLLRTLGQVERRHRLVRSSGVSYVFDHHQVQEALYGSLSELLRREYHAALASVLEAKNGAASKEAKDLDGALCVDLAEHFLKGAQGAKALRYFDAALTHLEKGYLNDAAIRLADRALAAPGLLAGKERVETLLRESDRLDLLGRRDAERAALMEAMALADAEGDPSLRARARNDLGGHLRNFSRPAEAGAVLGEALVLARGAGDRKTEASATGNLGNVFRALGRCAEAHAEYERFLSLAREIGDRRGVASAMTSLGNVFTDLGRYADAQAQHERCLALAQEIGDRRLEAIATGNLGTVFSSLGRFAEAQAQYEGHLALAREIGDRRGEASATGNLGNVFRALGRWAEAQVQIERVLALSKETGDRLGEAIATGNLANVFNGLGRYADGKAQLERHLALAREIGNRQSEAIALVNLGPLRRSLGDLAGARRDLTTSLEICREIGARYPEGFALLGLASVADEAGDAPAAMRHAEESLALRRSIGHRDGVTLSLERIADLRRRAGDLEGARKALEEELTLARKDDDKAAVATCLAVLANLPGGHAKEAEMALADAGDTLAAGDAMSINFFLWQATRDRAHLVEAKRLLDFLVEHAPPECRESMLANVRVNREIVAACKEQGL